LKFDNWTILVSINMYILKRNNVRIDIREL